MISLYPALDLRAWILNFYGPRGDGRRRNLEITDYTYSLALSQTVLSGTVAISSQADFLLLGVNAFANTNATALAATYFNFTDNTTGEPFTAAPVLCNNYLATIDNITARVQMPYPRWMQGNSSIAVTASGTIPADDYQLDFVGVQIRELF